MMAAVAVFGLLIAGTFKGDDDQFPFGPFRMYASAVDNNGAVRALRIDGVDDQGHPLVVQSDLLGMRRAEFEGELPRLEGDQALLDSLARHYRSQQQSSPKLRELVVVETSYQLVNGKQEGGSTERVVATGHAVSS
jgi:hypothetical protein